MDHHEFVQNWKEKKIQVTVNRSAALQIAGSTMFPKQYRFAHHFWSWIWFISIPASFVTMYVYSGWVGLFILVAVGPALSWSVKQSAFTFMIDYALENSEFYNFAIDKDVIRISEHGQPLEMNLSTAQILQKARSLTDTIKADQAWLDSMQGKKFDSFEEAEQAAVLMNQKQDLIVSRAVEAKDLWSKI
jgi:hypothetical protein